MGAGHLTTPGQPERCSVTRYAVVSISMSRGAAPLARLTRVQVFELVGEVLVLVDPLAVALEEDLQRRRRLTPQPDGVAPDDEGVLRLLQEVGQRPRRRRRCVRRTAACRERQQLRN